MKHTYPAESRPASKARLSFSFPLGWLTALLLLAGGARAQAPSISSFSPITGAVGSSVVITGSNLSTTTAVRLGEVLAPITARSATSVTVTVPRLASTHKLALTTPVGQALSGSIFRVTRSGNLPYSTISTSFNGIDVGNDVGDMARPAFTDLDGDGLLDLLLGKESGELSHYEQSAANSTAFTLINSNFSGIGVGEYSAPAVTDFDGDGLLDLLVGEIFGRLHHYEQNAANSTAFTLVTTAFNGIDADDHSIPFFTDLDGDGRLDLLVGKDDGQLRHYEQSAANSTTFSFVTNAFNNIDVGSLAAPLVTGFDGLGKLDLLVGNATGALSHFTQDAVNSTSFTLATSSFQGLNAGSYSVPAVTDLDGDGLLDLVVGCLAGTLSHYEQARVPTITSFTPASGAVGTSVTITGTNLGWATSVSFNGTAQTTITANTETSLTVAVPTGASTGTLTVTTGGGTSAASSQTFTVIPAPAITSFTPSSGSAGASISITGTNLSGATAITFSGTSGNVVTTGFTVASSTSITGIVVPAGAATGPLTVTAAGGTSAASNQTFTVIPSPAITSFTPTSGLVGTSVTLTGTNLTGATSVSFNGTAQTTITANTATSLTVAVPTGATTGTLTVTTAGATSAASAQTFSVLPAVTGFTPASGGVGASVTITGTNLSGATSVSFNGTVQTTITANTATSLTVAVPNGATTGPLTVTTTSGTSAASSQSFTVIPAPAITSFTPTSGVVGASVTLTGTNLSSATSVSFNGTAQTTITANTATSLTVAVPAGATTGTLTVTTAGGTSAASSQTFSVLPAISAIVPNVGRAGATTSLTGTGLSGATAITFSGTSGNVVTTGFTVASSTSITGIVVPAGAATGPLTVTTAAGTSAASTDVYTIVPAPTITSFTPASGGVGTSIVITGTDLATTTAVRLGEALLPITARSATSVTVTVPPLASTQKLALSTLGGQAVSTAAFAVPRNIPSAFTSRTTNFNGPIAGIDSAPAFTDLDGDGLLDMLIGNQGGGLLHYEQAASNSTSFTQVSGFFNNIAVANDAAPTFTDLDGDGLLDMLVGSFTGSVSHYEQAASNSTSFTLVTNAFNNILTPQYVIPTFTDLDGDGLLDMLIGRNAGTLAHYEQNAANSTAFTLITDNFNSIDAGDYAAPIVADLDGNGRLDLVVGQQTGHLHHYEQSAANSTVFSLVTTSLDGISGGLDSAPALTDLDGDGWLDLVVGLRSGSLSHYEQELVTPTITAFTPSGGLPGTSVTIIGTSLSGATSVSFNGTAQTVITANTATSLTVTVPVGATTGPLTVTSAGVTSAPSSQVFVVAPAPTITSFSPGSGAMGSSVVITGTNLANTTTLRLGEVPAPITARSATSLTITVPRLASTHKLALTAPTGTALSATAFGVTRNSSLVYSLVTANLTGSAVVTYAAPEVTDLDGDGLLDLLVGNDNGRIAHYEQSAATSPSFTLITSNFNGIDVGNAAVPAVTDLDGDGLLDLLVGKEDGSVAHYEQSSANSSVVSLVTNTFNSIDAGRFSAPAVTDLDGDGLLDLLVGHIDGQLHHYEQIVVNSAIFTQVTTTFNGIDVGDTSAPEVADLNGNGLLDLVVGQNNGQLSHYEQSAANSTAFALVSGSFNSIDIGIYSVPVLTDLTGDGLLDLVVGKPDGTLSHFTQLAPAITGITPPSSLVGTSVTITGTNLTGATAVSFNGTAATSFTVNSATSITVTVPAGASSGNVTVTTPVSTSSGYFFTVLEPLQLTALSPTRHQPAAPQASDLTLTFNQVLDGLTTPNTRVFSAQHGGELLSSGRASLTTSSNALTVNPTTDFRAGETVFVTVPATVQSSTGAAAPAHVHQFTAAAAVAPGGFGLHSTLTTGTQPLSTALADVDGDGDLDLVNVNNFNSSISVRLNNGTASFGAATDYTVGNAPSDVTAADVDNDGDLDLLVSNRTGANSVSVLRNSGTGTFTTAATLPVGSFPSQVQAADLNADGWLDLVVANSTSIAPSVSILLNLGTGAATFASATTLTLPGQTQSLAVGDLDNDGDLDLALADRTNAQVRLALNNGSGSFTLSATTVAVGTTPYSVALADVNNDGRLDVLTANYGAATASVALATGTATFGPATAVGVGASPTAIATGDVDGDGDLDLLTVHSIVGNSSISVRLNDGVGTFSGTLSCSVGSGAFDLTLGDLNGNHTLDLVTANSTGTVSVLLNVAPPAIAAFSPASGPEGTVVTITGTGLAGVTSLNFNGTAATFTVVSATQITATVPGGATSGLISLSASGMTATSTTSYTVTPAVLGFTPASGTAGTVVTLTGTSFTGATAVSFNGTAAASFTVNSATQLTATAPAGVSTGPLSVTTATGTSSSATSFLVLPTVSSFAPASGMAGTVVTLTGTALDGATAVFFNGTAAASFTVVSSTQVQATLPLGTSSGTISVVTPGGTATTASSFTLLPQLISFSPASGPVGTRVYVTGDGLTGLSGTTAVRFNGTNASSYVVTSSTALNALVGTGTTTGPITIVTSGGTLTSASNFTITPTLPAIQSLSTTSGPVGTVIQVQGSAFFNFSTYTLTGATVNGVPASFTRLGTTQVNVTVPAGATGTGYVTLTSGNGTSQSGQTFTVLDIYNGTLNSCLSTTSVTSTGANTWQYLLAPNGQLVAALKDGGRALGTVYAEFEQVSQAAVRSDNGGREYLDRNWHLVAQNSFTGTSVEVKFYGLNAELARYMAANDGDANDVTGLSSLRLTQYSGPNENCVLADNGTPTELRLLTPAATEAISGTDWFAVQATVADHFSEFYLNGGSTPLPVELTRFTAIVQGPAAVALGWTTASEQNSAYFDVERSPDGRTFERIGQVAAQGSKASPTAYAYLDSQIPTALSPLASLYYRLRQVDADGTASYSPVRAVPLKTTAELALYPNPTSGAATLSGVAPGTTVQVLDALGREVATQTADGAGTVSLVLPASLNRGLYVVRAGPRSVRLVLE